MTAPITRTFPAQPKRVVPSIRVGEVGAATSRGLHRESNDDRWGSKDGVFVVADGIGGVHGGHIAAAVTVDELPPLLSRFGHQWQRISDNLSSSVMGAGAEAGFDQLGTTFVAAQVQSDRVAIAYAGDSRAYRFRSGRLQQLTYDHNVRSELLDQGQSTTDTDLSAALLNSLTSSVGAGLGVNKIDAVTISVQTGDRLLLCTDGVHDYLAPRQLRIALSMDRCQDAAETLTRLADEAGGYDNATAVVIEVNVEENA